MAQRDVDAAGEEVSESKRKYLQYKRFEAIGGAWCQLAGPLLFLGAAGNSCRAVLERRPVVLAE
jgi:hypothetical protein